MNEKIRSGWFRSVSRLIGESDTLSPLILTSIALKHNSKILKKRGKKCLSKKQINITSSPILSCFKTLDAIEEEEPKWFINNYYPKGQIGIIAAEGGVGKTTICVDITANRSIGQGCFLDPIGFKCEPQTIAFFNSEDSIKNKLKRRIRESGANMENIIVADIADDKDGLLRGFNFGTEGMSDFVRYYKPDLCIFDPLQGFLPRELNMGSRNAMRDCLAPLVALGEEVGTTFLIVCHTNKRKGAYGRDRISDSADIWDLARSVLMLDFTDEQGERYLSHEKSNYGELQDTKLFSINRNGKIISRGTTWKRDKEFQQDATFNSSAPRREEVKQWLLNEIDANDGAMPIKDLESKAAEKGYSKSTLRRAKDELKDSKAIHYFQLGSAKEKTWYVQRASEQIKLFGKDN